MKKILCAIFLSVMCNVGSSNAALLCSPAFPTTCTEVNSAATGGGMHTSEYGITGNFEGQKATYALSSLTITAEGSASALPFFVLCGSDTKVVRIQYLNVSGAFATTAGRRAITLRLLYRAPITTNPGAVFPRIAHDLRESRHGEMFFGDFFTNYSSADYVVGTLAIRTGTFPITATPVATDVMPEIEFNFDQFPVILRSINYCVAMSFDTAPGTVPSVMVSGRWTESDK